MIKRKKNYLNNKKNIWRPIQIRGHLMDKTNTTFICQGQNLTWALYEINFVCAEIRIIICRLLTNENTGIYYNE